MVALHLGVGLLKRGVTINPGEDFDGRAHVSMNLGDRPDIEGSGRMELLAQKQAIVSLVRMAAQRRFSPRSARNHHGGQVKRSAADKPLLLLR